ncbi:MAG: hypothetical protein ACOYK8_07705 [Alphaproteobacteria bacterium]
MRGKSFAELLKKATLSEPLYASDFTAEDIADPTFPLLSLPSSDGSSTDLRLIQNPRDFTEFELKRLKMGPKPSLEQLFSLANVSEPLDHTPGKDPVFPPSGSILCSQPVGKDVLGFTLHYITNGGAFSPNDIETLKGEKTGSQTATKKTSRPAAFYN